MCMTAPIGVISILVMTGLTFAQRFYPIRVCAGGCGNELSLVIPCSVLTTKDFVPGF
jgi:hypothetical protein